MEGALGLGPQEEEGAVAIAGQEDAGSGSESAAHKRGRGKREARRTRAEAADEPEGSRGEKGQRRAAKSEIAVVQKEVRGVRAENEAGKVPIRDNEQARRGETKAHGRGAEAKAEVV